MMIRGLTTRKLPFDILLRGYTDIHIHNPRAHGLTCSGTSDDGMQLSRPILQTSYTFKCGDTDNSAVLRVTM